eukprot:COSAG02_NODE_32332_length_518_cov_0.737470_1_plen_55_part_01
MARCTRLHGARSKTQQAEELKTELWIRQQKKTQLDASLQARAPQPRENLLVRTGL